MLGREHPSSPVSSTLVDIWGPWLWADRKTKALHGKYRMVISSTKLCPELDFHSLVRRQVFRTKFIWDMEETAAEGKRR